MNACLVLKENCMIMNRNSIKYSERLLFMPVGVSTDDCV